MVISSSNAFVKSVTESRQHRRARFHEIAPGVEKRRGDLVRQEAALATTHVINGTHQIDGAGESLVDIVFPVLFVQPPIFLSAAELAPGQTLVTGLFPSATAVISYWDVAEPDLNLYGATLRQHFRGAQLAVTASGATNQRLFLHWQFTGMAVANPHSGSTHVPDVDEQGNLLS